MAEQKIDLRKIRDFGEIISDTFVFIRQNFKPLMGAFLGIAGVFMLGSAIINGIYQSRMGSIFQNIFKNPAAAPVEPFAFFNTTYLLVFLLTWLNVTAMQVTIIGYMKVYDRNGGITPSMEEVWNEFKRYYLVLLLYSVPIILLTVVGFFFCILPGIWLWVVFVPFDMLIMVENRSFGDAFNRCFSLVSKDFWMALGVYIVCYLIYSVSSGLIGTVVGLLSGVISYFTTDDWGTTWGVVVSVLNVFSYLFFVIYFVAAVLNYFNLTERYEGTGMLKKLDSLGTQSTNINHPDEQY